jgi:putative transposase
LSASSPVIPKFDHFIEHYNQERPHEAPEGRFPAQLYRPSCRPYTGLSDLRQVFAGRNIGVKEVPEKIWLVSFMHYDLSVYDRETGRTECAPNPFGAELLSMSPG